MASTRNSAQAMALGAALREARQNKKMTTRDVGAKFNRDHTAIVRIESGKQALSVSDTRALLEILDVNGEESDRLLKLASDAADLNWVAPGVTRHLAALAEYEKNARRITNIEPLVIPGLLQTEGYARSIMLSAGATRAEADQRVTYRMDRREILTRSKSPVEFHALIGEAALRYPPCKRETMADQLRNLIKWSELDNVTIQAVPLTFGYSSSLEGPCMLIEFDKVRPLAHIEHYRSATTLTDIGDVRDYLSAAETLGRDAMSPLATRELIAELADEMEHTS